CDSFWCHVQVAGGDGGDDVELCSTHLFGDTTLSLGKDTDHVRIGDVQVGEEGKPVRVYIDGGHNDRLQLGGSLEVLEDNSIWVEDRVDNPGHPGWVGIDSDNTPVWGNQFRVH